MRGIKKKGEEFLNKISGSLKILEFEELFKEIEDFASSLHNAEEVTEEEKLLWEKLRKRTFWKRLSTYEDYINRWDKMLFFPNEEELKKLKNHQKNLEDGKRIDEEIDEYLRQSPSLTDKFEKQRREAKETKKILDQLLENDKYRQQAEELLKKYKDKPISFDENNEDKSKIDEQISSLQNQIKELEKNQTPNSNNKQKQELERLKKELEELKSKGKKNKGQEQSNKDNFPWGIVIASGLTIVVLLILIIILLRKIK